METTYKLCPARGCYLSTFSFTATDYMDPQTYQFDAEELTEHFKACVMADGTWNMEDKSFGFEQELFDDDGTLGFFLVTVPLVFASKLIQNIRPLDAFVNDDQKPEGASSWLTPMGLIYAFGVNFYNSRHEVWKREDWLENEVIEELDSTLQDPTVAPWGDFLFLRANRQVNLPGAVGIDESPVVARFWRFWDSESSVLYLTAEGPMNSAEFEAYALQRTGVPPTDGDFGLPITTTRH